MQGLSHSSDVSDNIRQKRRYYIVESSISPHVSAIHFPVNSECENLSKHSSNLRKLKKESRKVFNTKIVKKIVFKELGSVGENMMKSCQSRIKFVMNTGN